MKSFQLKISGREQGPFSEIDVAQMFADGQIDKHTPCRPSDRGDWKSVDDYLPTLKYGTQLPPPTPKATGIVTANQSSVASSLSQPVAVVDFNMPFKSILNLMFKWMAAGFIVLCCFLPVIFIFWFVIAIVFAGLISGLAHLPRH